MIGALFASVAMVAAQPASVLIADPTGEYVGPEFREKKADLARLADAASNSPELIGTTGPYGVGDKASYYVDGYGTANFTEFEKRGEGTYVEIWVATDLKFPEGDPRNADPEKVTINTEQVEYLIDQFDEVIYPIESDYFGTPAIHDGSSATLGDEDYEELYEGILNEVPLFQGSSKLMIMVWNMVDESYYDPTYPSYTAGYYSPSLETYYDRNIIHVDSYDWANRIGPDVARPFVYESTIAHEYQHLLHDDLDENEVSFINEGCSMYAEMLCGYGAPWGYIEQFLFTPDNSLTEWGDQGDINIIADYGAAAMFAIYLNDHFGGADFISALAANPDNGEAGVTSTLASEGYADWDFDQVFYNWRMANLIHSDAFGGGWYNYESIDLNDPQAGKLTTLKLKPGTGFSTQSYVYQYTYTLDGYNTGAYLLGPYGTDYLKVQGTRAGELLLRNFEFDGSDLSYPGWYQTTAPAGSGLSGSVWYSGASDLRDVALVADLTLGADAKQLSFDTYYFIEEQWDFGFVQVSTDDGATWTSLSNDNTRSDLVLEGHPDILDNMPGFTGLSSGKEDFDISAYAGQTVKLAFRYMTDWGYTEKGWYVDNIAIDGAVIDDAGTISAFESALPPEDVDFMITIYAPAYTNDEVSLPYLKVDLSLDDGKETVKQSMAQFSGYKEVYVIISSDHGPTNYMFGLLKS